MGGVKVLISWGTDPFPLDNSFSHYLIDYFQACNCPTLKIDSERGGKLNYLRAKLGVSPLFSPASYPDFVDGCAFLRQEDEENWVVVCEWTTLQKACEQLAQPIDSFLIMCHEGKVYSVQKPQYERTCIDMRLDPYPKVNIPLPMMFKRPQNQPVLQIDPTPPLPLPNPITPNEERPSGSPEERKVSVPNPSLGLTAIGFVKPLIQSTLLDTQIKDSEAKIQAQTKAAEAAIAAQISQIPTQPLTDPNLQGEAVGREVSRDLQLLVEGRERAAKDLCMQASKQVAASMADLVRATKEKELDYRTVAGEFDQQAQMLAYRLQQVEQQFANAKTGASIQVELAQLEGQIQEFEQIVHNLVPPTRFPLRILSTCGTDANTGGPCPVLVIQWKDWASGNQLRLKLDAQGGIQPSEVVLTKDFTLLPYTCQQNGILIVTPADSDQFLCKQTIYVYTAESYSQSGYLADWGIDTAELEMQRTQLYA